MVPLPSRNQKSSECERCRPHPRYLVPNCLNRLCERPCKHKIEIIEVRYKLIRREEDDFILWINAGLLGMETAFRRLQLIVPRLEDGTDAQ